MHTHGARLLASLALLSALAACTATPVRAPSVALDPRSPQVLRGDTGAPVSWNDFVSETAQSGALVLGENHGHPLGLATAAALWSDVLVRAPRAALALEFFERDEQCHLDDYLTGLIDEAKFREATGRKGSNYPDGHRAMVEAAKAAGRPVSAGNAPRVYVRLARTDGYERLRALTPEQQRLFHVPDEMIGGTYRAEFDELMSTPHVTGPDAPPPEDPAAKQQRLDHGFRSQHLWDWTMADAVARLAAAGNAPIVQVIGRFHSDKRGGFVQALERLRPGLHITTVSFVNETASALRDEDKGRADFVIYVGPSTEP
jgi:uncharacterized iron-regulated protein